MSIRRPASILACLALLAGGAAPAAGQTATLPAPSPAPTLALSPLFADHAVLQRDRLLPVWGTAAPGETVTVRFHHQAAQGVAGPDGRWLVRLGAQPASSEPAELAVTGRTTVTVHDLVVGDLWVCSGQSNMEFKVDDGGTTYHVDNARAEIAAALFPLIRQLEVERAVAGSPAAGFASQGWKAATPGNVGHFTAVGYFFARDIHRAVGVPIGLILTCWGGTPVEAWMNQSARASTTLSAKIDSRWQQALAEWPPERVAQYPAAKAAWDKAEAEAAAQHTHNTLPWPHPPATSTSPDLPGGLFNAMIAPLQPAAVRGFLWYQGESNTGHADEYAELFGAMIRSWRVGFAQGDLPFYFVQLANYGVGRGATGRDWAALRDAQTQTLALPATGMAVTIDIGSADNIHPRNKQEVGRRLALLARASIYGVPPESRGPQLAFAAVEGKAIRVHFTHAGDELEAHGGSPSALELAGADRVFQPAMGTVDVDTLVVTSPLVPAPVAVRYAWTNAPIANLFSDDGLPVVPFRTDNW